MKIVIRICSIIILLFITINSSSSQSLEKGYGIGVAFGSAVGRTDVGGFNPQPISRIFARYQPIKNFAIESGFGFGLLDQQERKLPNNARRVYSNWMGTLPMGVNFAYSITPSSIIELSCSYSLGTKDYLDDIKANKNNDGFFFAGINVYAFFESENVDPDGYRLKDGEEILVYKTDPLTADTDLDGLNDGNEIIKYKTDPLKADTDNGGVPDGIEVSRGTDPNDPKDDYPILKKGVDIILKGITFEVDSDRITSTSEPTLDSVALSLIANPEVHIEISGHTDNIGPVNNNMQLSKRRAESVKQYLIMKGVEVSRRIEIVRVK